LLHFAVEADRDLAALVVDVQVDQRVGLGQLPQRREQPTAIGRIDRLDHGFKRGGRELAGNPAGDSLAYPAAGARRADPAYPHDVAGPRDTRPGPAVWRRPLQGRDHLGPGARRGDPVPYAQLAAEYAAVRHRAVITVLNLVDD